MSDQNTGRGRNKGLAKKRAYKEHCRLMRVGGYVTDSEGRWTPDASYRGSTAN